MCHILDVITTKMQYGGFVFFNDYQLHFPSWFNLNV